MTDILASICIDKKQHIKARKAHITESQLLEQAKNVTSPRGFLAALQAKTSAKETALITEVKKASPSKGVIRADFDHLLIAGAYEKAGATCISVLTDRPYFQGKDEDMDALCATYTIVI